MENNKVIGYLLIILLLVTYYTYFVPNYEVTDLNEPKESIKEDEISINADSLVSFSPKLKKANGINPSKQCLHQCKDNAKILTIHKFLSLDRDHISFT